MKSHLASFASLDNTKIELQATLTTLDGKIFLVNATINPDVMSSTLIANLRKFATDIESIQKLHQ